MSKKVAFLVNYRRTNTYALNTVVGALETRPDLDGVSIRLVAREDHLATAIRDALPEHDKIIVAWSFYSPDFSQTVRTLHLLKSQINNEKVFHLAGGVHATAEPEQTLRAGFDLAVNGEGENAIISLITALVNDQKYLHVKGVAYLDDNRKYVSNGMAERVDLNDYPPFASKLGRFNPIEITRGCIYACKFCQTPFMFKARFRHRTVANVIKFVEIMRDRGLTDVRFITPTSLSYGSDDESVTLDKIEELLAGVRSAIGNTGRIFFGTFPSEVRPEHVTYDALRVLKKYVDNNNLIIGGQSGSQNMLDLSHRGHAVADIVSAVRISLEVGFIPNVDFIFGLPGETEKDVQLSLRLAERLTDLGARIHGHTFLPLPGTPFRNAPPGTIQRLAMQKLKRLESRGKLYGQWKQQVTIARNLAKIAARAKKGRNQSLVSVYSDAH